MSRCEGSRRRFSREWGRASKTAIDALAETPRPPGVKKLVAEENLYRIRIRVGDYRVLFQVQDRQLLVLIVKVGHHSQIYR